MENQTLRVLAIGVIAFSFQAKAASYKEVWQVTQEGKYEVLPHHPTTLTSFFSFAGNLLAKSANRTLTNDQDYLPRFQKLVHPIGICYAGTWKISEENPYSGYFSKGSEALIIVRASEAMGHPLQGDFRSFGIAGKLFPTQDKEDGRDYKTANFFTVDDLGGTNAASFLDLPKTNSPATSLHPSTVLSAPVVGTIIATFRRADSNPGVRQLYPISELGLSDPKEAVTPGGLRISSVTAPLRNVPEDFRNELRLQNYKSGKLEFSIEVAKTSGGAFRRIGTIELTEEALTDGCDHRLHFAHPQWRN